MIIRKNMTFIEFSRMNKTEYDESFLRDKSFITPKM